jgi:MSHA biogenesis protein MshN
MSLINKMLHDLDRRSGFVAPGGGLPLQQVRPIVQRRALRFWARGFVGLILLAGVGRIAWIAHELRPRPALATELAFRAEAEARARPAPPAVEEPKPAPSEPVVAASEPEPAIETEGQDAAPDSLAPPRVETLKLALSIDTPIVERHTRVARTSPARPVTEAKATAPAVEPKASALATMPLLASSAGTRVERHDRTTTGPERADAQFNSAMNLLNAGRVAETEDALGGLIASNPLDERARQALVALLLDQRRLEEAVLVLRQGIALNPAQTQFALVLARILAERRDYGAALEVLTRAQPAAKNAEFSNLLAAVLQRLARHREAVEAYRAALDAAPGNAGAWMGLAISLESLQERGNALEAYRRALTSASLSPELRAYADQKVKELR